jgi:transposase
MTKTQAEIVTSVRQRRRWSRAEKERIVAAAMEPGAVASVVAREAGIQASQLFRWRRQLHGAARVASLTLKVPTDAAPITAFPMSPGVIEVEFTTGARLRIRGPVDVPIVAAVMQALTDCGKTVTIFRGFKHRPLPTGSICHRKDNGDVACLTVGRLELSP